MSTTTLKVVIAVRVVLLAAAGWQIAMMANKAAELEVQSAFLDAAFEAEIDQADQELAAAQARIEEPEALLAEMGGTSFRDFVGWFEGLCAAADVDELCDAAEGVAVDA